MHRVNRADVVDDAIGEVQSVGQRFARFQQVADAFVRGIAAGEHLAVEQQSFAGLKGLHLFACQRVEVHTS